MKDPERVPNLARLRRLALLSAAAALLGGYLFWRQIDGFAGMGWIGVLIVLTLTIILYSLCFVFAVMAFENTLERYIVSDKFRRKNKWIDVETETRSSSNAAIDRWVQHYVFTRTLFAMGILPLLACIYLFWIV